MALPPMPPVSSPTAPGVAGAGTQPGQPPFGSSPVQMPTPDRGAQAGALAQVAWAVRLLEQAVQPLGMTTDVGQAITKAISSLAKHIPQGSTSPGVEQSALRDMMMKAKQDQPQQAVLSALGQGQPPGGQPPAQPPQPQVG